MCKGASTKNFHHAKLIWAIRWVEDLGESIKKGKFVTKKLQKNLEVHC